MNLKTQDLFTLIDAYQSLDGNVKAHANAAGQPTTFAREPFHFSGKTMMKIARNQLALRQARETYEAAHKKLVEEFAQEGENQAQIIPADKVPAFQKKERELVEDGEHEVALQPLTEAELNLDRNAIAASKLTMLLAFGLLEAAKPAVA